MTNSKQRKIGAILSYIGIIINTLISLLYTPFMLRMIGQSEYGLYSLVASIIGYLTVLDLGFGNGIIVYTSRYREKKEYEKVNKIHGMFLAIYFVIGLIVAILGTILLFNVDNLFGNTMSTSEISKAKVMMIIMTINLAITFPFTVYSSIISAYEKFIFQKVLTIIQSLLNPLIMIPLLILGYKSIAMVSTISILNIATLIMNYLYCKRRLNIQIKFTGFDKKLFKEIFNYSFFVFLGVIVDKVNWSIDQFILGAVSGTIAVSLYSVAGTFNTLFMNISSCCCGVMLPKLSKMVTNNVGDDVLSDEFIKFGRLQWYLMSLILCGFTIYGKEFIKAWAGLEYEKSYYIALILIIPVGLVLVENIGVYIMQAKNLHKSKAIITSIAAIFNILISIPLAIKLEGIGSAIGTATSLIICNLIIINIYYQKKVKLNVISFWKNIFKISIPLAIIAVSGYMINIRVFRADSLLLIGINASIFSLVYYITAYIFCFNKYEKNMVKSAITLVKRGVENNDTNN